MSGLSGIQRSILDDIYRDVLIWEMWLADRPDARNAQAMFKIWGVPLRKIGRVGTRAEHAAYSRSLRRLEARAAAEAALAERDARFRTSTYGLM